jgi:hypothetical protein
MVLVFKSTSTGTTNSSGWVGERAPDLRHVDLHLDGQGQIGLLRRVPILVPLRAVIIKKIQRLDAAQNGVLFVGLRRLRQRRRLRVTARMRSMPGPRTPLVGAAST